MVELVIEKAHCNGILKNKIIKELNEYLNLYFPLEPSEEIQTYELNSYDFKVEPFFYLINFLSNSFSSKPLNFKTREFALDLGIKLVNAGWNIQVAFMNSRPVFTFKV